MDKLLSLLGIARRAGKLALGNDPVLEAIRKQDAKLILAAVDLSTRTQKGIAAAAQTGNIPLLQTTISMDEFGFAIGKRVGILSVNDAGFAEKIRQLWNDMTDKPQTKSV